MDGDDGNGSRVRSGFRDSSLDNNSALEPVVVFPNRATSEDGVV